MADAFVACAFFYARGAGPAAGSGTLARDGVRPLCLRWGQALCQRWGQALCQRRGQAPLPAAGSGTLPEMGSGTLVRDGVRHLCLRWGQALCQRRGQAPLPAVGSDPIGDCDISALALYSVLFYNSWCWWQHKYSIRW